MPWLTILMSLLSFFVSKRNGASNTQALLTAGLAGAGTYYVTHETDWGKTNLGAFDGVIASGTTPLKTEGGVAVTKENGTTAATSGIDSTIGKLLTSAGGTAAAATVGGFTFGALLASPNAWKWVALAVGAYFILS